MDEASQNVYEGLSSNFFVFDRQSQSVVTAPLNCVLQGTILKVVLAVCEKQNIPIEFKFPNLNDIDYWEGAFITSKDYSSKKELIHYILKGSHSDVNPSDNSLLDCEIGTSRLVLPIGTIVLPDGSKKTFDKSPAIESIRSHVLQECQRRVEPLLTVQDLK